MREKVEVRVSVIVPLFNKAETVRRCLNSIAGQSWQDFEAIIVDDGSSDGGADVVAEFGDPRFRLVRQPNAGPGAARNRGIAEARGECLAFLDADDEWMPEYLSTAMDLLGSTARSAAAVTCLYSEDSRADLRRLWAKRGLKEGFFRVTSDTSPSLLVHALAFMSPCTTVARAETVRAWGGFWEGKQCRYGEDAVLWLRILLHEPVFFHFRTLVRLHRQDSSLSNSLSGPRPLEPFLADPRVVADTCPPELLPLLDQFYAWRAAKSAAVAGSWGQTAVARQLLRRFVLWRRRNVPYLVPALLACTPLGPALGAGLRTWLRLRRSLRSHLL